MEVAELDALSRAEAVAVLAPLVAIDSWAEGLADARPLGDRATALDVAARLAAAWSDAEVEAALAGHPRIGERPTGGDAASAMSRREQAGVGDDDAVRARLAAGNAAYEARFDRIYLVRARGRDAEELLALLEQRLGHDDATERGVVAAQLAEITLLRLADLLDPDPAVEESA